MFSQCVGHCVRVKARVNIGTGKHRYGDETSVRGNIGTGKHPRKHRLGNIGTGKHRARLTTGAAPFKPIPVSPLLHLVILYYEANACRECVWQGLKSALGLHLLKWSKTPLAKKRACVQPWPHLFHIFGGSCLQQRVPAIFIKKGC